MVAFRLATLVDESRSAQGVRNRLAERFADVVKALRTVRAYGLLYASGDHRLLLSGTTGSLAPAGSDLPGRILVAGDVPLPDGPTVSFIRSGAQLVDLASRTRRRVGDDAVFIANPRGDRRQASMDALLLRRTFYPQSTGLGDTGENTSGPGTPDEVPARLGASLLHLGCGVTADGGLELAGSAVLEPSEITAGPSATAGGLAVLPSANGVAALTPGWRTPPMNRPSQLPPCVAGSPTRTAHHPNTCPHGSRPERVTPIFRTRHTGKHWSTTAFSVGDGGDLRQTRSCVSGFARRRSNVGADSGPQLRRIPT